ncbi:MAG: ribulokinase [candidate division KSB1 bacterium]|nr:ribulokinase [candidate division KSB1 bacterium]MDZ7295458.1 ribulokinase [candidate division KSB1 bacterium]MDZ7337166.1 ribulokinase [candidate division KSB1 bacterium]MDZ7378423.1 ribulokinase [candidate division KSB1 bacterium]MDZ7385452.1 ribulokinase [candidate division KSB1 bacterium]
MGKYTIGIDFGTNSCRAVLVDITDGRELATTVYQYPSGTAGIILDPADPNLARQNPADYVTGLETVIPGVITRARENERTFSPDQIIGIGIDTTGSSPVAVDEEGVPLCFFERFRDNPAAMVWLWKDHTSYAEAQKITEIAQKLRPHYLAKIGGAYSSEWFWSKLWHLQKVAPEVFAATYSFVEICDWIPALLVGDTHPARIKRSVCAAGHKALYNAEWGGLPDEEFLKELSPEIAAMRSRLYQVAYTADQKAGNLSPEWAKKLGLSTDVVVTVGAFDAHMGAVGAGVDVGVLVKILGTSTCDIMVWPNSEPLEAIPGVCGIVDGSVLPGYYGIEAGQSAVGDIFLWFVNSLVPGSYGSTAEEKFERLGQAAARLRPGESGLLALDWNNGNRTILVDVRLTGLLLGQTLHTQAHEVYRALIEATAFGALTIIDRIQSYGVPAREIVNCGGLATKNPLLMQIYADVTGRPMKVARSDQAPALGAAIFAAVAAGKARGGYDTVREAKEKMTATGKVYHPDQASHRIYQQIYKLYRQLHDAFGTREWSGHMYNVMKDLLEIRDRVRKEKGCSNS